MKKNNILLSDQDPIAQTAMENLNLSAKKAVSFAKQARALQHNLTLRKKQMQERQALENRADKSSDEK